MDTLIKLTNPSFPIEFGGKTYDVRKASLGQVVKYTQRLNKLSADKIPFNESWLQLIAYAVFLILSPQDNTLTEEFIMDNMEGNIDPSELLIKLGFISPKRVDLGKKAESQPIIDSSSQTSATGQDGLQTKSPASQ